ncbi:hypothetical protein [Paenibacillus montanisoli]|uniref:Copper amine oxidase-like N-terminal domain-containing protein n=1 Tax=Paenibacillus montanisoli TaxID=2081970 RepID=A0A328U5B4_9BACL|nr:hypothetical protein [Paenibacillus montanisoli]RAP78038.1 hypothetical protein DL346_06220 [Paenibacillus montanisoli]
MNKKKLIIVATVAGLLGTTVAAEASGFLRKVNGMLRGDITVTVDGQETSMEPVFINGKAYLPAKSEADALGYDLRYNAKEKRIEITSREESEVDKLIPVSGVIETVGYNQQGDVQITVLGRGNWIVLTVDKDTALTDQDGKKFAAKNLKAGMEVYAEYGPVVAMSYPGQSHAAKVVVGTERLVREDVIQSVEKTSDGWQVRIGKDATAIVLNAGKETSVVDQERQPLEWSALKPGMKVTAYYGPIMTKSLPPISPLFYLVADNSGTVTLSPAETTEYRNLAWNQLSNEQKKHLITKKDEAEVTLVPAADAAIFPQGEEKQKAYEAYKAKNGNVVLVTYKDDQEALLGPLTLGFNYETKEFFGFRIRK